MDLRYENTFTTSGKPSVSRVIPRRWWVNKTSELCIYQLRIVWRSYLWVLNEVCVFSTSGVIKFNFVSWGTLVVREWCVVIAPELAGDACFCWFFPKKSEHRVRPRFLFFFVSGVKGVRKRGEFKISLSNPKGERFSLTPLGVVKKQWVGRRGKECLKCGVRGQTVSAWNF